MNNRNPANQSSQALVSTGQNSTPTPTTQNKKPPELALLPVLLRPGDVANLLNVQASQQPVIHNHYYTQINHYNGAPPETKNLGQQSGSQDRLHSSPQTTSSASRAIIEDKTHVVANVPSAQKSTQEKSPNGSGDKVTSSRPTEVQARTIPDKSRVAPSSAHIAKPATGQVASRPAQDGSKKPTFAAVLAGQVPGHGHREAPKPKSSQARESTDRTRRPDPPRGNGSHRKETAPTSATTSHARGSDRSGSREDPAVKQSQNRAKPQAALHLSQAQSESKGNKAHKQPVVRPQHRERQPVKREEAAGASHGHSAVVTKSKDHRTGAVSEAPKELSEKHIRKYLDDLNSDLAKSQAGTSSGQARLILIGKASTKMMGLKSSQKVYHIDVMLERGQGGEQVRRCVERNGIFREFDRPEQDTKKAPKSFIFGNEDHRDVVIRNVFQKGECISDKEQHLQVYLMDHRRAFEFELRRMADPDNEENKKASLITAEAILSSIIERGRDHVTRDSCRTWRYINADHDVPEKSINEVAELYKEKQRTKDGHF